MKKYSKKYWVFRWLFLAGYLAAAGVLIFESCLPRESSAKRSQAVGQVVGGLVNDINGDQAEEVMPTKATITNTKVDYKVGQEVQLDVTTEPSDATYQSYAYSSSNKEVASVDETGLVSFLMEGNTTITAKNTVVPEIYDTITFNVSNVAIESMSSTINAALDGDVYKLEIYEDYVISNVIKPKNATLKLITYDYPTNDYFTLEDDTIHVIGDSNEEVIEIKVTCGEITNTLKVKTFAPPPPVVDYPLEELKASNVTKYTDETSAFKPTVSYVPTYTSSKYKGYELTSSNDTIVQVQTDKTKLKITGTEGTATITATSTYNPEITKSFTVTVKVRPHMSSATLGKYSSVMYVGKTQTVSVTVSPTGVKSTKTFSSSNSSVVSVTNAGKLTAVATGTAEITVNVKDSYGTSATPMKFNVEVREAPPANCASDFVIDYKQGENPTVYVEEEFNLDDYFGIASFIGNTSTLDPSVFDFNFDVDSETAKYEDHKFTPHKVGEVSGYITYTNEDSSVISKEIKFTVIDRFEIYKTDGTPLADTTIELDIYSTVVLIIKDRNKVGQSYSADSSNIVEHSYASKSFTITAKEAGTGKFKIYPVVGDQEFKDQGQEITFVVHDVMTTNLDVYFYKNNEIVTVGDNPIVLYMNETLDVKYALDENTTKSRVSMKLNNANATIRNGVITPSKIGDIKLTVSEGITGLSKEYDITIKHKVALVDDGPFTISGSADYDAESNTIVIINGSTAKISINFTEESTYKKVSYIIADTAICSVGADGTITPKEVGQTKVTVLIKDSITTHASFEINIKVDRKPFIEDMNAFFMKVRKAIGHFGAFAVFGFLGAMTWFLFLRKKLFPVGVVANFGFGFGLSWLTEYIQKFTPGRTSTWSDVWLDFDGFCIVAGATTLVIVGIWLTKFIIRLNKNKKQKLALATEGTTEAKEPPKEEKPIEENDKVEEPIKEETNNETGEK